MNDQRPSGDDKAGEGKSLAELCVHRRKEVRRNENLSSTAKLLFDALTDDSFLGKYSVGFGIVRIGKPSLADELGCSVPTITRCQTELTPGEIWTRNGWYEGHEITIWFLRGVASNQLEFDQFTSGVTRAPRTKVAPRVERPRNGHGHFCKLVDPPDLLEKQEATADLTGHNGHSYHVAPVIPAGATTSNMTVVNRQTQPSGPGRNDRGRRSNLTGPNGHSYHDGHVKNDAGTRSGVTGYKDVLYTEEEGKREKGPDTPPISKAEKRELEVWLGTLARKFDKEVLSLKTVILKQRKEADPTDIGLIYLLDRQLEGLEKRLFGPGAKAPAPLTAPARAVKPGPAKRRLSDAERDALAQKVGPALRAAVEAGV